MTHTGDVLQIALPVIGGISTLFTNPDPAARWDREGTRQFAFSYGSAWSTTYAIKLVAGKARPNGNNRTSFPSGHTMSAFAGAAAGGGTEFQLGDLKGNNDPTTTATANVSIPVSARGRINASYGPFEARDEGTFTRDVAFAGRTYAAGTPMVSAWRFYDLRAQYEHLLLDRAGWTGRLGAGLGLSYSYVALQEQGQDDIAVVDDTILYPYAHASLGRRLSGRLGLELAGDGVAIGDDNVLDLSAQFTWRAARAWDFTLGYAYFTRQLDSDTYSNKVRYSIPFATVTRYW